MVMFRTGLWEKYFFSNCIFYRSKPSIICIWITPEDLELIDMIGLVIYRLFSIDFQHNMLQYIIQSNIVYTYPA